MAGYPQRAYGTPPGNLGGTPAASGTNTGSIVSAHAAPASSVQQHGFPPHLRTALAMSPGASESGRNRSSQRGVHFFEAAPNVQAGALFSDHPSVTESKSTMKVNPEANAAAKMPLTLKDLTNELSILSPILSDEQRSEINKELDALLQLLQQCTRQCGSAAPVGELQTVGAYHMGVASPGDSIDVVFVAPANILLAELSDVLRRMLQDNQQASLIRNACGDGLLTAPGLQFCWRGIDINLLFALSIPDLPLASSEGGIVQSTAGTLAREVADTLLGCVSNPDQYRLLLRFVRFWAKQRGIYGSIYGYFSGTAWAICCARVCQQYPKGQLPQLVGHFFRVLGRWDWSMPFTIMYGDEQQAIPQAAPKAAPAAGGAVDEAVVKALMTVLLPVGQGLVATSNVSETTMKIIQKEFRRGVKTAKQVELFRVHWSDVYNSARFFKKHRHYLEFDFMASNEEIFAIWHVWAKKQIEGLVQLFENTSHDIVSLRPWPEFLEFKDEKWPCARAVFCGLHLERGGKDGDNEQKRVSFDLREPVVKFLEAMARWPEVDKYRDQFELEIRHVKIDQLETWLDNREKGLVAHGASPQVAAGPQGLFLQNIGEKTLFDVAEHEVM